jgi:putative Holliday junction resolvase
MNGDISDSARRSLNFKKRLLKEFGIEVVLWDERLSSVMVDKIMISMDLKRNKRKKIIDEMAAITILQGYLDARK